MVGDFRDGSKKRSEVGVNVSWVGAREEEQWEERTQAKERCKGGNNGNSGNSGKRKYDEGAKVGVEGRGCGHVLDHRIMLLCPGWVGALGITMVDTVLWILPWTRHTF